jgi:tRNA pseudouridine55 synthase
MSNNSCGIFLLDKPTGISSHRALQRVKRLFKAEKAGHTGTLDPLASGMLPICLGEAVKFSQFLLDADKAYRTVAKLGAVSSTGDAEGEISGYRLVPPLNTELIESVLTNFRGEIQQVPSMYSAIKHQGRPLYDWARKGHVIERTARLVTIHRLELIEFTENTITLDVVCSKGTYIRSLVEDIGNALTCGAYMQALRRTYVAPFNEIQMQSLDVLENTCQPVVLPITDAMQHIPSFHLDLHSALRLMLGQRIPGQQGIPTVYRVYDENEQFIGIAELTDDGVLRPRRMMSPSVSSLHKKEIKSEYTNKDNIINI